MGHVPWRGLLHIGGHCCDDVPFKMLNLDEGMPKYVERRIAKGFGVSEGRRCGLHDPIDDDYLTINTCLEYGRLPVR
jgi:hypothetical protein